MPALTSEPVCCGCCRDLEPFEIAHEDTAPPYSSRTGLRAWCEDCVQEHRDGHPGKPESRRACSPETCPKVPREDG